MEKKPKNKIIYLTLIVLLVVVILGGSYAFFVVYKEQDEISDLKTACLDIDFIDGESIAMTNEYPLSDAEGMNTNPYRFTVKNKCDNPIMYQINLELDNRSTLNSENVKVSLNNASANILANYLEADVSIDNGLKAYRIYDGYLTANQTIEYEFRHWLKSDADPEESAEKNFISKITVLFLMAKDTNVNFIAQESVQEYTVPITGCYKIELWGAAGGKGMSDGVLKYDGGKGAYTSGVIELEAGEKLYLYVGTKGSDAIKSFTGGGLGGYNGGGKGGDDKSTIASKNDDDSAGGGGGATDVRYFGSYEPSNEELLWNSNLGLRNRIMVAAGGGGSNFGEAGGAGADLESTSLNVNPGYNHSNGIYFGYGENGKDYQVAAGGGGGGYYGGTGENYVSSGQTFRAAGSGGNSFISGYAGVLVIENNSEIIKTNDTKHYSNKYFLQGNMTADKNSGNGKAKITYLGDDFSRTNDKLDEVRYVKSCINGNSSNVGNHWVELQVIKDGSNLAYGKSVTGTVNANSSYPYSNLVNGSITLAQYAQSGSNGNQCITVDLEDVYQVDEIALWLARTGNRIYKNNVLSVSNNNTDWIELHNYPSTTGYNETTNGRRYTAWD